MTGWNRNNTISHLIELVESTPAWKPRDGADVLEDLANFILRFVVLTPVQVAAIALWIVHTHVFQAADTTPYLNISSAEKRSGKTRLLEVLELLVARPWFTGRVTAAVLARKVDAECPTLLLDESDAAFKGEKEYAETLRGILNSGYRRGGKCSICVGQGVNIGYKDLSTFCPKVIAGIGKLPDTISDRSIPIELKRRAPNETVEQFRRRDMEDEAMNIRNDIIGWSANVSLEDARPEIPEPLNDRSADCWEPLLAIADVAGAAWPDRSRQAAITLMTDETQSDQSLGIQLLSDIRLIFEGQSNHLSSSELAEELNRLEESPWGDIKGRPLTPRKLASFLKPYDIRPRSVRVGNSTPKGYQKEDFQDAWNRYIPVSEYLSATSATLASNQLQNTSAIYPQQTPLEIQNVADNSRSYASYNVADVADNMPPTRDLTDINLVSPSPIDDPTELEDNDSPEGTAQDELKQWRLDL